MQIIPMDTKLTSSSAHQMRGLKSFPTAATYSDGATAFNSDSIKSGQ